MITWVPQRIRAALTRQPRHASLSKVNVAGYTFMLKGVPHFDWRDTYHYVITLSWPRFLLLAFGAHIVLNICFALLYLLQPGAIAQAHPGSLADAFFFSVETFATVGYGEMYPATLYGHCVSTTEIFTGVATTALTTGLLFVRFSRPTARFRYATNAVIASHQGCPTLMIRIANGRRTVLYDASAHLGLLLSTRRADGQILRRVHELRLSRSRLPIFTLTWTLMHRIDETSPLNGFDAAMVRDHDARLLLGVAARDATLSAEVSDTKGYGPEDVIFGMRYIDVLSFDAHGYPVADLSEIGQLERDIGPEPAVSGWEDADS
jgi:inward rectifier potassium channel